MLKQMHKYVKTHCSAPDIALLVHRVMTEKPKFLDRFNDGIVKKKKTPMHAKSKQRSVIIGLIPEEKAMAILSLKLDLADRPIL
jgi:hypothetical protein